MFVGSFANVTVEEVIHFDDDFNQSWSNGGVLEYGLRDAQPSAANAAEAFLHSGIATVPNYNGAPLADGLGNTGGNVAYFFTFSTPVAITDPWFAVRKNEDGDRFAVDDIVITYYFDDADEDGLPDQEEALRGTDPDLADSDGDGFDDGPEVADGTNPLDPDSDADGYEVHTLTSNPLAPGDPGGPNPLAIGINFVASAGQDPGVGLPGHAYGGAPEVAQHNWNQTVPVTGNSGGTSDIDSPVAGTLVDSRGDATGATLGFTMNNPWSSNNEDLTPFGKLMSGYLDSNASNNCQVTVSSIPYPSYDVWAFLHPDSAAGLLRQVLDGRQGDPGAKPPFLDGIDPPEFLLSLVSGLGSSNPSLAADTLAASVGSPVRTTAIEVLLQDWYPADPSGARNWAAAIANPETRQLALVAVATKAGQGDQPEPALTWAMSLPAPRDQEGALKALTGQWSQRHAAEAFAWTRALPDGDLKFAVMPGVLRQLAIIDPGAAADWLNEYEAAPAMDASIVAYAKAIQFINPPAALGSAAAITDPHLRETLTRRLRRNMQRRGLEPDRGPP